MAHEEIGNILKSSYGEDLGYDSDDIEYEYYSKFKHHSDNLSGFSIINTYCLALIRRRLKNYLNRPNG